MRAQAIQVVTTTAEKKDAETLAQAVLDNRLGACVQISGPIESRYWWNGRIETASEWTLRIKTRHDLYKQLEKLLLELHPYDQPEIMATAVAEVSAGYLKWLTEQVAAENAEVGDQKSEVGGQKQGDKGTKGRTDKAKE